MNNQSFSVLLVIILIIFIAVLLSYGLIEYGLNVGSLHSENITRSTSQEWEINPNINNVNDSRWNLTNYSLEKDVGPGDIDIEKSELSTNNNKTDYWMMVLILIGVVALCLIGLIWYSFTEIAM